MATRTAFGWQHHDLLQRYRPGQWYLGVEPAEQGIDNALYETASEKLPAGDYHRKTLPGVPIVCL